MLYGVHLAMNWNQTLITLVVIGTDFTDSWKGNYHTIKTMMAPNFNGDRH
jgi:hypothetical protein